MEVEAGCRRRHPLPIGGGREKDVSFQQILKRKRRRGESVFALREWALRRGNNVCPTGPLLSWIGFVLLQSFCHSYAVDLILGVGGGDGFQLTEGGFGGEAGTEGAGEPQEGDGHNPFGRTGVAFTVNSIGGE